MSSSSTAIEASAIANVSPWRVMWRGFVVNRGALAGLVIFGFIVACALLAGVLAPHDPPSSTATRCWRHRPGTAAAQHPLSARHRRHRPRHALAAAARRAAVAADRHRRRALSMLPGIALGLVAASSRRPWAR
jgi:dipeptide transport system permease protein